MQTLTSLSGPELFQIVAYLASIILLLSASWIALNVLLIALQTLVRRLMSFPEGGKSAHQVLRTNT